jgi:hypothetical protein
MDDDIDHMARYWNAGYNTQDIARAVYGLTVREDWVYARIELVKAAARRMRRAARDFDDLKRTSRGEDLRKIEP